MNTACAPAPVWLEDARKKVQLTQFRPDNLGWLNVQRIKLRCVDCRMQGRLIEYIEYIYIFHSNDLRCRIIGQDV